ncbi:hypothetical protein SUGI_0599190 [Cryptomeria japonica]|nr:hypothetical protein SUGI_0599190 [Cryptomeria japonica]
MLEPNAGWTSRWRFMHLKSWSIKSGQERVRGFVLGTGSGTEIHTFEAMAYKIRARQKVLTELFVSLKDLETESQPGCDRSGVLAKTEHKPTQKS